MLTAGGRKRVIVAALLLLGVCWLLARHMEPQHQQYVALQQEVEPGDPRLPGPGEGAEGGILEQTAFQALIPAALGIREVIASLLWIQVDSYFHRGEYGPVLDMVHRIVTIDPHQIDVYAQGAWHMAYNFLDKRLIHDGIKFLERGIRDNPHVYDLYFELGYMHVDKTKDFHTAIAVLEEATRRRTSSGDAKPPLFVYSQLAHALERAGLTDEAAEQWRANIQEAIRRAEEGVAPGGYQLAEEVARHNYYIHRRRMHERRAAVLEREGRGEEALRLWQANVEIARDAIEHIPGRREALEGDLREAQRNVQRVREGRLVRTPLPETQLEFQVERVGPRRIEVSGTLDVIDLSRVMITIRDKNYEALHARYANDPTWRVANLTLDYEHVSIGGGRFRFTFDFNRDPADMGRPPQQIYPLKSDEYEVIVQFDPRLQPLPTQDRYGWHGERLNATDGLYEDWESVGTQLGEEYPRRYIERRTIVKREDIVG